MAGCVSPRPPSAALREKGKSLSSGVETASVDAAPLGELDRVLVCLAAVVVVMAPASDEAVLLEEHEEALDSHVVGVTARLAELPRVDAYTVAHSGVLAQVELESFARATETDGIAERDGRDQVGLDFPRHDSGIEGSSDLFHLVEHFLGEFDGFVDFLEVRFPVVSVTHD